MALLKTALTKSTLAALAIATVGTAALAYATDPDVKARQELMSGIGAEMKKIGPMAQGQADFDAAVASAAIAAIAEHAAAIPAAFETNAKDPESKANPAIWENWEDFVAKAEALHKAAADNATVDSLDGLTAAMGAINPTCKDCHSTYKAQ